MGEEFPLYLLLYTSVSLKVGVLMKNELFVNRYPHSTAGESAYVHKSRS